MCVWMGLTPRFPMKLRGIMKINNFPSKLIHFHGKSMKNNGFSEFPNVCWEIWVSIQTTPHVVCRPIRDQAARAWPPATSRLRLPPGTLLSMLCSVRPRQTTRTHHRGSCLPVRKTVAFCEKQTWLLSSAFHIGQTDRESVRR